MAIRQRQSIGVGGLYPTGRAPLSVDLSETSRAITERMIKREQERITGEKTEIAENQKKILHALSSEAVLGASEKMQTLHLQNVNETIDKWSDKLGENDGKLSHQDNLELLKEKQKIDRNLTDMKTNVKNFRLVQEEILRDKDRKTYSDETHKRFGEMVKQGKVGDPTVDWLSVLVPREEDMFAALTDPDMKPFVDTMTANIDTGQIKVNEDGTYSWGESNERILEQGFKSFLTGKRGKTIFRNYGGDEQALRQMENEFESALIRNTQHQEWSASLFKEQRKDEEGLGISMDTREALKRNNLKFDPKYADNVRQANEMAELIRLGDEEAINTLKNRYIPKLNGTPENIFIQYGKDGVTIKMRRDEELEKVSFPYAVSDDTILNEYKLGAFSDKPGVSAKVYSSGKQLGDNIAGSFAPRWKLDRPVNPMIPGQYEKEGLSLVKELKKPNAKIDLEAIKEIIGNKESGMLPDAKVEVEGNTIKFNGEEYQIKRWFGGRAIKGTADIEKDKERLKADVLKKINEYRDKLKSRATYAEGTELEQREEKTEEEKIQKFMNDNNITDRKEAIRILKENNIL